jgi:hypothetical protein
MPASSSFSTPESSSGKGGCGGVGWCWQGIIDHRSELGFRRTIVALRFNFSPWLRLYVAACMPYLVP